MKELALRTDSLFVKCFHKLERIGDNMFECIVWNKPFRNSKGLLDYSDHFKMSFPGETPFEAMESAYKWLLDENQASKTGGCEVVFCE